ncbi:MAG: hypothetical protein D6767_02640 [Candidatus Hydrogenedentota bacterium]|nr:MAG: hypothetical protein D6767_02640 [Candidatus Hydrogenedentota bacterium]
MKLCKRWWLFSIAILLPLLASELPPIPVTPGEEAKVENLSEINTKFVEYTPFILPDETILVFESNRPGSVGLSGDFDLWYALGERVNGTVKFKPPVNFGPPVNSAYFDGLPSLRKLPDGSLEMYFTSFATKGRKGKKETNIYYTKQVQGKWTDPIPLSIINSDFHDRMPSISPDGLTLYFSSNRPGGYGKDDIWIAHYDTAKKMWQKPVNAGSIINSGAAEISPSIHSDGITLYFSSDRDGGVGRYDIYVTQKMLYMKGTPWKKPQNLGKPYNSPYDDEYPTVTRDGLRMYFSSNRKGGYGSFDVYRAKVPEFAKPKVVITYKGKVHEADSIKGIEANIRIRSKNGERNIATQLPAGAYEMDLMNDEVYEILISAPGYEPYETILDLRENHRPETITKNFSLLPEFQLPDSLSISFQMLGKENKIIRPNVTYRLVYNQEQSDEKIMRLDGDRFVLTIPVRIHDEQNKRQAYAEFIKNTSIIVSASLTGYDPLKQKFSLADFFSENGKQTAAQKTLQMKPVVESTTSKITVAKKETKDNTDNKKTKQTTTNVTEKSKKVKKQKKVRYELIATLRFGKEVTNLSKKQQKELFKIKQKWIQAGKPLIEVQGHTDRKGGLKKNIRWSKERAYNMRKALIKIGIPKEKIRAKYFAYRRPLVEEKDEASKAKNRRVEVYFVWEQ